MNLPFLAKWLRFSMTSILTKEQFNDCVESNINESLSWCIDTERVHELDTNIAMNALREAVFFIAVKYDLKYEPCTDVQIDYSNNVYGDRFDGYLIDNLNVIYVNVYRKKDEVHVRAQLIPIHNPQKLFVHFVNQSLGSNRMTEQDENRFVLTWYDTTGETIDTVREMLIDSGVYNFEENSLFFFENELYDVQLLSVGNNSGIYSLIFTKQV